jgi:hypothetical protein
MDRDLRLLLYAGIHLDGCYVPLDDVAWIRSLLGLPLNQRGQGLHDDASTTASLIVSLSHWLDGIENVWFAPFRRFIPLLSFEDQSPDRGRCYHPNHRGGWT